MNNCECWQTFRFSFYVLLSSRLVWVLVDTRHCVNWSPSGCLTFAIPFSQLIQNDGDLQFNSSNSLRPTFAFHFLFVAFFVITSVVSPPCVVCPCPCCWCRSRVFCVATVSCFLFTNLTNWRRVCLHTIYIYLQHNYVNNYTIYARSCSFHVALFQIHDSFQ